MKHLLSFLMLFFSLASMAGGEELVRTSINIVDAQDGLAIIGAAISIEGVSEVFYSDPDGRIEFEHSPDKDLQIHISYISMEERKIRLSEIKEGMSILLYPR